MNKLETNNLTTYRGGSIMDDREMRYKAITKLIKTRFTLYSPLEVTLDDEGHLCYENKELTVHDCLFYLNIATCLNQKFSICNRYMRKGYNLSGANC